MDGGGGGGGDKMAVLNNKINIISNRNCYFFYHCSSTNYREIFKHFYLFDCTGS